MGWNIETILVQVALLATLVFGSFYLFATRNKNYWKKRGVHYADPIFPFGNIYDVVFGKIDIAKFYDRFYKQFKSKKYGGILELWYPALIITDLDLVRQILTRDFPYFMNRVVPPKSSFDFLLNNLFFMDGKSGWKETRAKLTPTFSSGKMKVMYNLIEKCSDKLKNFLEPMALKEETFDVKEIMSRFTLDTIATCAFGLEVNSLKDTNTDIYRVSKMIMSPTKSIIFKRYLSITFPKLAETMKISLFGTSVSDILLNMVTTTVKYRVENNITRGDFLDLLIKIKNEQHLDYEKKEHGEEPEKYDITSMKNMTAEAFVFFAAGFETAAATTTFVLYELACNPRVQERLRKEIDEVVRRHGGQVTYQALQEMTYMEQVVNESMRLHGPALMLLRKCVEPYRVPGTNLILDKDLKVVIPLYSIHRDPDIYPDPEVFDPERFSEENIRSRHNYAFLPFGEGPRMCIAMRFGKMQVKAGLATIISNFEINVTPETPIPLEISPKMIIPGPENPIKLRISKR